MLVLLSSSVVTFQLQKNKKQKNAHRETREGKVSGGKSDLFLFYYVLWSGGFNF